jgi:hypothetical protein
MTLDDIPGSHRSRGDYQNSLAAGEQPQPATGHSSFISESLADPFLALAADVLDDLEKVRIANENRLRQLTRSVEDSDGRERGFGLMPLGICEPDDPKLIPKLLAVVKVATAEAKTAQKMLRPPPGWHPDIWNLCLIVLANSAIEHQATLNLERMMRKHPLGPWAKTQKGVGDKQIARLLAVLGDPYIRPEIERDGVTEPARPREIAELWAYCGYHVRNGIAVRRTRGEHANWNAAAKMRAHLVAESCIKQSGTRYRAVYDTARTRYEEAVHEYECIRCGPKGFPKQPGTPLSDGHKHGRAMRAVAKEVLLDLWKEGRRLHTGISSDEGTVSRLDEKEESQL